MGFGGAVRDHECMADGSVETVVSVGAFLQIQKQYTWLKSSLFVWYVTNGRSATVGETLIFSARISAMSMNRPSTL